MGPTASGKTALAGTLLKQYPFEIISVDSAMIYREMDIGTAKPSAAELAQMPHHLLDILNPDETYSAAQFCSDAHDLIKDIHQRGNIPLLAGGTMMYFQALQTGLSQLPSADETLRARLSLQAKEQGWPAMHQLLQQVDLETATRIHAHDTQRIQRALEVYYLTGTPLSQFLKQEKVASVYQFHNVALFPDDRAWLHARIALRFEHMLTQGFLEEASAIFQKWSLNEASPALRCVGYRQAYDLLQGRSDFASFKEKALAATRQLAKRQLTWLRHWPSIEYIPCDAIDYHLKVMAVIDKIIDNELKP